MKKQKKLPIGTSLKNNINRTVFVFDEDCFDGKIKSIKDSFGNGKTKHLNRQKTKTVYFKPYAFSKEPIYLKKSMKKSIKR